MIDVKGNYIDMVKIQTLLTTIDFSNNSFKGEILKVIGKLESPKGLNFSHNNLMGHIPISSAGLKQHVQADRWQESHEMKWKQSNLLY